METDWSCRGRWIRTRKLSTRRSADAITRSESVKAYEPSASSLWAIYVRGLAYLQAKSGREAAVEFQKILDHRGVSPLSPLNPLAGATSSGFPSQAVRCPGSYRRPSACPRRCG